MLKEMFWVRAVCLGAALSVFSFSADVSANPIDGTVVAGSASIQGQGTANLTVNQATDKAIINWKSFNIGVGETTNFIQPGASSIALNRVTGDRNPSQILGTLTANGRVFLVNPDGVIFGPNAKINTAGLVATTSDIANNDFMEGRYDFTIPGSPSASIVNKGNISISDMGIAALVAPAVRNEGVIAANLGKVSLGSAQGFTLDFYGDNLINFALNAEVAGEIFDIESGEPIKNLVENKGVLSANGGTVVMSVSTARAVIDSVINNSGTIEARSVGVQNGQIILSAQTAATKTDGAPDQKVVVSGTLDASGKNAGETGGKIQITGESIELQSAVLDVSGDAGGGRILVGGDYQGGHPDPSTVEMFGIDMEEEAIPTATNLKVENTRFDASALTQGDAGKIVLWSDDTTNFAGILKAAGGLKGGKGGFIEVSGKQVLYFDGSVDVTSTDGKNGTLLLDPTVYSLYMQPISIMVYFPDLSTQQYIKTYVVNRDAADYLFNIDGSYDNIAFAPGTYALNLYDPIIEVDYDHVSLAFPHAIDSGTGLPANSGTYTVSGGDFVGYAIFLESTSAPVISGIEMNYSSFTSLPGTPVFYTPRMILINLAGASYVNGVGGGLSFRFILSAPADRSVSGRDFEFLLKLIHSANGSVKVLLGKKVLLPGSGAETNIHGYKYFEDIIVNLIARLYAGDKVVKDVDSILEHEEQGMEHMRDRGQKLDEVGGNDGRTVDELGDVIDRNFREYQQNSGKTK